MNAMIWAAILALVVAMLIDHYNFLIKSIGYPLAAVLALFGLYVFVDKTPIAKWCASASEAIAGKIGEVAVPILGQKTGDAVSKYLIAAIVVFVAAAYIAAMIPKFASKYLGDAVNKDMNSALIWGGAFVLIVGGALVPGGVGDAIQGLTKLGVDTGGAIAGFVA